VAMVSGASVLTATGGVERTEITTSNGVYRVGGHGSAACDGPDQ